MDYTRRKEGRFIGGKRVYERVFKGEGNVLTSERKLQILVSGNIKSGPELGDYLTYSDIWIGSRTPGKDCR